LDANHYSLRVGDALYCSGIGNSSEKSNNSVHCPAVDAVASHPTVADFPTTADCPSTWDAVAFNHLVYYPYAIRDGH
jgi:hypothetical protein